MPPDIKFCGITRREDAAAAAGLGAQFVGTIFAGGARQVTPEHAKALFSAVHAPLCRVGVFADALAQEIASIASLCALDVVQLHSTGGFEILPQLRELFRGKIWVAIRVAGAELPADLAQAFEQADAVVLDSFVEGALGGTGVPLHWSALAASLRAVRGNGRLVLAGGLRPENVAEAIVCLSPDIVDVSSGVESSPGIKDHARMRAFRDAVACAAAA